MTDEDRPTQRKSGYGCGARCLFVVREQHATKNEVYVMSSGREINLPSTLIDHTCGATTYAHNMKLDQIVFFAKG